MIDSIHKPVLLKEIIEVFKSSFRNTESGERELWYLDGTFGGGGHAKAVYETFHRNINIIGLDQNPDAIEIGRKVLRDAGDKVHLFNLNSRDMDKALERVGIEKVDMILLDLGISSDELENSHRGFTFQKDEPLLMTMGDPNTYPFTAKDIVNKWKEEDIANVIFAYGEERFARRIARAIVAYREKKNIETTFELAEIVKSAVPKMGRIFGRKTIHPATKTFQALRIAVNDELNTLKICLDKSVEYLNKGGVLAVISFHSLEDRIVKQFFHSHLEVKSPKSPIPELRNIRKPVKPKESEIIENPRSRSAKLRFFIKSS
jgi:16S rRNA (cytosine1402-N4)-methyltransferase